MKKLILFAFLTLLFAPIVQGYGITYYPPRGRVVQPVLTTPVTTMPVTVMPVTTTTNSTTPQFGSNAAFTEQNRIKAGEINRQRKYEQQYYENLKNTKNINVNINTNGYGLPYYNNYNY